MSSLRSPQLSILVAAALFATGGAAIKTSSLSAAQIAGGRSAVAAAVLLLLVPAARRRWTWAMLPVACAHAATFVLLVHANRLTTAANAVLLQSTAPLFVLVLGPLLLGERPSRRDLPFVLAMAAGAVPFFLGLQAPYDTAPDPPRGDLLAACSGLTWGLTLIGLRWLRTRSTRDPTHATVVLGNLLVVAFSLPAALPLAPVGVVDGLVVLYLGAIQVALAYVLLTRGLVHVSAFEASLLILAEPVLNVLLTYLVHGGALILAATTLRATRHGPRAE